MNHAAVYKPSIGFSTGGHRTGSRCENPIWFRYRCGGTDADTGADTGADTDADTGADTGMGTGMGTDMDEDGGRGALRPDRRLDRLRHMSRVSF